jgi:predicted nucleic acid-binding protein
MILLDTCVLSEMRRTDADPRLLAWFRAQPEELTFLSAVTIGEIERGVGMLEEGRRKKALGDWLDAIVERFGERILPVDTIVARRWGSMSAASAREGRPRAALDMMIAATALAHDAAVATRNVADFLGTGVRLLNPWDGS